MYKVEVLFCFGGGIGLKKSIFYSRIPVAGDVIGLFLPEIDVEVHHVFLVPNPVRGQAVAVITVCEDTALPADPVDLISFEKQGWKLV